MSLEQAKAVTERQPANVDAWKILGAHLSDADRLQEAKEALEKACQLDTRDCETLALLGQVEYKLGYADRALEFLSRAVEVNRDYARAHHYLGYIYHNSAQQDKALYHCEIADRLQPNVYETLNTKGNVLVALSRQREAVDVFRKAISLRPKSYYAWNNLANAEKDLGRLNEALSNYEKASCLAPEYPGPFSNIITTSHYLPDIKKEEITKLCKKWNKLFGLANVNRPETSKYKGKCLRIGLISDGFRGHPVGRMVTSAVEEIVKGPIEFYFYSTSSASDYLTTRLQKISSSWAFVEQLNDSELADKIRRDEIDILIDMAGHNAGNRMLTMAMQPAPLLVKWVGGLINTTGIEAIDYLITDSVETPPGCDTEYVENLIRMPDDYICYDPPHAYTPDVVDLPANRNGYLTFGCFNNAIKINEVLLKHWVDILVNIPNARLYLKSHQYSNSEVAEKITSFLEGEGIAHERVLIEGPSSHAELLQCYNNVDIALDPWPYSGGLTTCEALLMGVPVITYPGPTFAGRHSASHLINAGLPELVANNWEHYKQLAVDLASDLESLSVIRRNLRSQLKSSPVCDAPRFAKHFTTVMRAIWQRYCEDKAPAALTFNKEGEAWFEGESQPVEIVNAELLLESEKENDFQWKFSGKIIALDNGAKLLQDSGFDGLRALDTFAVVGFDPVSRISNPQRFEGSEDVQLFPHAVLGNGQPATLYACLSPEMGSTLHPLPPEQLPEEKRPGAQVLTTLPINTITLDSIEGLQSLDWLILDDLSDSMVVLEHGEKALRETLLIQARVAFQPTHERQPNLTEISHWMSRHGFRFYRLNDLAHRSHLPVRDDLQGYQATELESADALFLPSHERLAKLDDNQKTKLAFLLHTIYSVKDITYSLIASVDSEKAERYLRAEGIVAINDAESEAIESKNSQGKVQSSYEFDDTISQDIDRLMNSH
ncbi:hypothetical protein L861_18675 [Litchfieldella anticariensis FP35 = DSM 16096]|uniref:protein O-GlcNAc transferase n=2 Tax=Litchfieldella anticariensis TaxID=258591 RepID=S2LFT3_LITA3|nr:hypothetical protein L861_18675 [Halomonas anticariensis FP35 = DSM 16096]